VDSDGVKSDTLEDFTSAGNTHVVTREWQTLDAIPDIHPHSAMLKETPLAIVVCGDLKLEKHRLFILQRINHK
jgi:hypothetical protein